MSLDNQLLLGIVFIVAGVALALLAYAAFLYRKPAASAETEDQESLEPSMESPEGAPVSEDEDVTQEEVGGLQDGRTEGLAEGQPEHTVEAEKAGESLFPHGEAQAAGQGDPEAADEPQTEHEAEAIATSSAAKDLDEAQALLMRQPDSGRLAVQVGGQTFSSLQELRQSEEWPRVETLFRDLVAWLALAESSQREPSAKGAEAPQHEIGGGTMIEQINLILDETSSASEQAKRAVRLVEGMGGEIRVYIGVDSYALDEVPDAEVRELIRRAVAEWESRQ